MPRIKVLDNLLRRYAGTHYQYDARGNLTQRWKDGKESRYTWDLFDRLTHYEDDQLQVDYAYDALGRRLFKHSQAYYQERRQAGPHWNHAARVRCNRELGCGFTLYGWDGDTLAWESTIADEDGLGASTTHSVYEPESFLPVAQAVREEAIALLDQPTYGDYYRRDEDPLWSPPPPAPSIDSVAWYHCDHLGTPQELTDEQGEIAWSAEYRAWGAAKEAIRKASAGRVELHNPIRFQGQYYDQETGLHYNRHRYYDPEVGRFVSKDPIGYAGGLNIYQYAFNPVDWTDPLGLMGRSSTSGNSSHTKLGKEFHNADINPYPEGYMKEQTLKGGGGRVDAINADTCSIIERKCTKRLATEKKGVAQLQRYCDHAKRTTGKDHEGILDVLNPETGERTTKVVIPKPNNSPGTGGNSAARSRG